MALSSISVVLNSLKLKYEVWIMKVEVVAFGEDDVLMYEGWIMNYEVVAFGEYWSVDVTSIEVLM